MGCTSSGHALDDLEPVAVDRDVLGRVVRHQAHLAHAEVAQDLAADAVVADVGREAELLVGRDGVVALVLQLVGLQLVDEADAAALLQEVEEHAAAGLDDLLHRELELLAAVAARRAEDVAGQALRVDAHEHRLVLADLAVDEGEVLLVRHVAPVGVAAGSRRGASAGAATRSGARAARSSSGSGSGRRP